MVCKSQQIIFPLYSTLIRHHYEQCVQWRKFSEKIRWDAIILFNTVFQPLKGCNTEKSQDLFGIIPEHYYLWMSCHGMAWHGMEIHLVNLVWIRMNIVLPLSQLLFRSIWELCDYFGELGLTGSAGRFPC